MAASNLRRRLALLAVILIAVAVLILKMKVDGVFAATSAYQVFVFIAGLTLAIYLFRTLLRKR